MQQGELVRLAADATLELSSTDEAAMILLAGQPIDEPIVQHGPFVMNTRQEIEQAIFDYKHGRLTA